MRQKPAGRPLLSKQIIRDIKCKTRKHYSAEVSNYRYLFAAEAAPTIHFFVPWERLQPRIITP